MTEATKPLRLFVAASVPGAELRRIETATAGLRRRLGDARWTPVANQHVTLKFLGATDPARLEPVTEAISNLASDHDDAVLTVGGLGTFPHPRRARVLWAGVLDEAGLLSRLAEGLAGTLAPLGYEIEKRPFAPHLTLARFRVPVAVARDALVLSEGDPFPLGSIELYRSHLGPKGARYEVIRSFGLRGSKRSGG